MRLIEPDVLYFITDRTMQGRYFLRPSKATNNDVGAALARAAKEHAVKVYAYVVTSNHVHLIVSGNHESIPNFMRDFKSWSAKKVGRRINWPGSFWHRRYSSEPILDDDALRGRYAYIIQHGAKEGLVDRPEQWPGLHCVEQLRTGGPRCFTWFDATGFFKAQRNGESPQRAAFEHEVSLELEPAPFASGPNLERSMAALVDAAITAVVQARGGIPSLGIDAIVAWDPLTRPLRLKRSPRPLCHASSRAAREGYRWQYLRFAQAFRAAVEAWRKGRRVAFPRYAHSPGGLAA